MLSPSSQLPSPPQSTTMWFSPPPEEPLSKSPVTSNSAGFSESISVYNIIISHSPCTPISHLFPSSPPITLVVPSQSSLWAFCHQRNLSILYSFASFLFPLLFQVVGSCTLTAPLLQDDFQITAPRLGSYPEHQTQISNDLTSLPACPTVNSSSTYINRLLHLFLQSASGVFSVSVGGIMMYPSQNLGLILYSSLSFYIKSVIKSCQFTS